MYYGKHEVDRAWPAVSRLLNAAGANFGPPGIFKWEGLVSPQFPVIGIRFLAAFVRGLIVPFDDS